MDNKNKKCFASRNKGPLAAVACLYVGVFYILGFAVIKNDIHFVHDQLKNALIIEVVKK